MREPSWGEAMRWHLHGLSDWFADRRLWRISIALDRCALALYRAFTRTQEKKHG